MHASRAEPDGYMTAAVTVPGIGRVYWANPGGPAKPGRCSPGLAAGTDFCIHNKGLG
jgi:hypothetical protein